MAGRARRNEALCPIAGAAGADAVARRASLAALTQYFREVPDPDRGYALAVLTGALTFRNVKPALLKDIVLREVDPTLFAMSYDYVGDLGETIALIWPHHGAAGRSAVADRADRAVQHDQQGGTAQADRGAADAGGDQRALGGGEAGDRGAAHRRFGAAGQDGAGGDERHRRAGDRGGLARAQGALSRSVRLARRQGAAARYRPVGAVSSADAVAIRSTRKRTSASSIPKDFSAEWKWDGIRVQLVLGGGTVSLFSRTGDDIANAFPDIVENVHGQAVLDGELLVGKDFEAGAASTICSSGSTRRSRAPSI